MKTTPDLQTLTAAGSAIGESDTPTPRARWRNRIAAGGRERGAAMVEFAIILPLLVALTFGIIEFSSAFHDSSLIADATRAGARVGSAKATDPAFTSAVVQSVNSALATAPAKAPQELWIYKANAAGYPGSSSSFSSCSSSCIKYTWSQGGHAFVGGSGSWPASSHQVCTQPYDELGVYIKFNHGYVTKLFGSSVTLTDHTVFRFEPVASSACAS